MGLSTRRDEYKHLSDEQFQVLVLRQTELPGSHSLQAPAKNEELIYACVNCGRDLFSSAAKFSSGTGWPSFYKSLDDVRLRRDWRLLENGQYMGVREEVVCSCGGHLGHIFRHENWDTPTGLRYCINAVALQPATTAAAIN